MLVLALSACTPGAGPTSSPSPTSTSSAVATPDASDVRGRLALGLRDISPVSSRLVSDPQTTLDPVPASWLTGWQILDVQNLTGTHPRRFYAALADDNRVLVLTGQPASFSTLLTESGGPVATAAVAAEVASVFLDSTRAFVTYSYRIESVDDIAWRPTLDAEQQRARDEVVSTYGTQIAPAQAKQASSGWTVSVWTVSDTDLVRHQVRIGSDRTVTDTTETLASDLPVPASR